MRRHTRSQCSSLPSWSLPTEDNLLVHAQCLKTVEVGGEVDSMLMESGILFVGMHMAGDKTNIQNLPGSVRVYNLQSGSEHTLQGHLVSTQLPLLNKRHLHTAAGRMTADGGKAACRSGQTAEHDPACRAPCTHWLPPTTCCSAVGMTSPSGCGSSISQRASLKLRWVCVPARCHSVVHSCQVTQASRWMQAVLTAAQGGHSVEVKALQVINTFLFSADFQGVIKVACPSKRNRMYLYLTGLLLVCGHRAGFHI